LYWDHAPLLQYGGVNWKRGVAAVLAVGLVVLVAHQLLITAWSNRCDPGNARFNLLKADAVVSYHPPGELFSWENDQPDNGWTCSNPSLSIDHVGSHVARMYTATRADMTGSGWTELDLGQTAGDFSAYQKAGSGNVSLTAVVLEQSAWVEVDLDAPGLHPGDQGF